MVLYPVRCCCSPDIVYGHLELPDGLREESRLSVMLDASSFDEPAPDEAEMKAPFVEIKLRLYVDTKKWIHEIAVYSDDHPIEFWRKLRGFTELKDSR